jgi:hypothetical protein
VERRRASSSSVVLAAWELAPMKGGTIFATSYGDCAAARVAQRREDGGKSRIYSTED